MFLSPTTATGPRLNLGGIMEGINECVMDSASLAARMPLFVGAKTNHLPPMPVRSDHDKIMSQA
jgi:hypothetical protein